MRGAIQTGFFVSLFALGEYVKYRISRSETTTLNNGFIAYFPLYLHAIRVYTPCSRIQWAEFTPMSVARTSILAFLLTVAVDPPRHP